MKARNSLVVKMLNEVINGKSLNKVIEDLTVNHDNLVKQYRDFNPLAALNEIMGLLIELGIDTSITPNSNKNGISKASLINVITKNKNTGNDIRSLTRRKISDDDKASFLATAIKNENIEAINIFIMRDWNLNMALDEKGRTPLILALGNYSSEIAKVLIKNGADININDNRGQYPIHTSVRFEDLSILKLLLEKGADINAKDNQGSNALTFAITEENRAAVELLIENKIELLPILEENEKYSSVAAIGGVISCATSENRPFWIELMDKFREVKKKSEVHNKEDSK